MVEAVRKVTRSTQWKLLQRLPLRFETYHPRASPGSATGSSSPAWR
ncbi:hypothetical protein NKH77_49470 [Streptomyces sp. M19]